MKSFLLVALLLTTVQSFASRGYLVERNTGLTYDGITDDGQDVGFNVQFKLQTGALTQAQLNKMNECMKKKTTHAILVEEEIEKVTVPTGQGRKTTVRASKGIKVDCVRAPGFLQYFLKFYELSGQ